MYWQKRILLSNWIFGSRFIIRTCVEGCKKSTVDTTAAPVVDFTLDLTQPANAALNNAGGYVYSNGVVVAKTRVGGFLAVSQACIHQGTNVQYVNANNGFYCPNHGSNFNSAGGVISGSAPSALKQYTVNSYRQHITDKWVK